MKLNSIYYVLLAFGLFFGSACSKKKGSSENPGRNYDVVPIEDIAVDTDDIDRGGDDDTDLDDDLPSSSESILLTQYRNSIPTRKVCRNILDSRNSQTLRKFFGWDLQNLEGPVTICVEQETSTPRCPTSENYCSSYPNRYVRIRIEYEDDLRFWYYDSGKETNYAKLLSYSGGGGASTVEIILQDGAGFLMIDGFKTSSGKYDVTMAFADRPSYSAARTYDTTRNYGPGNASHRAATFADMRACARSENGAAKTSSGSDCAARFVFPYQFYTDLNTQYSAEFDITDVGLWVKNQVTIARQYVKNQFPSQFADFGVVGGTFGRLLLGGL